MAFANTLIFVGAALILLSIFAGIASSRLGAPLLLVFLALGMLAGEDGPGGIRFDDFETAYTVGAVALAIVLFDGGIRTRLDVLRMAAAPALTLVTAGVLATAVIMAAIARELFDFTWVQGLLLGAIVAPTDAAAVFFLLHQGGINLSRRVNATLEAESGLNDPMSVFLAISCLALLRPGAPEVDWGQASFHFVIECAVEMGGGALIGVVGGFMLVALINRLKLASGLYPILALAAALLIFSGAQVVNTSGFLAIYIAGLVVGNRRHRAHQLIDRFQDGMAWLAQIIMFVLLGLLVTPTRLVDTLVPASLIAGALIVIARPAATVLCLAPFRFGPRELAFISWVGLRGAVPIFIATLPVLAGLDGGLVFFDIAFVVVLASLLFQGWTVNTAAHFLKLALPHAPAAPLRHDIELPDDVGRDMAAFAVREGSLSTRLPVSEIAARSGVEFIAVIRDGGLLRPETVGQLQPGDQALVIAGEASVGKLDPIFGILGPDEHEADEAVLGEFFFDPATNMGELSLAYEFPLPPGDRALSAGEFLKTHLRRTPEAGDRFRLGPVELVVSAVANGQITRVGMELDPEGASPWTRDNIRLWLRHLWRWRRR